MLEILITTFVAAFVLVALFGHVMVAKAMMTPDQARRPEPASHTIDHKRKCPASRRAFSFSGSCLAP